jgi:hypothetical protein
MYVAMATPVVFTITKPTSLRPPPLHPHSHQHSNSTPACPFSPRESHSCHRSHTLSSLCITSSSNPPCMNVPDTTHQRLSPPMGPAPTYSSIRSSQHADSSSYYKPELVTPQTTSPEAVQGPVPVGLSQAQGSPQPNKPMFDFISPFDALASSSAAPVRKPAQPSSHQQGPFEPFKDT